MALPVMTFDGRLASEPELRFTPGGKAVVSFNIVSSKKKRQEDGSWADEHTTFLEVSAWERTAENVADSLQKGDAVVVVGEFRQRSYENREGQKRTVHFIHAYTVAAALNYNAVEVKRVRRDQPAESRPRQQQKSEEDVWGIGSQAEEPPF